jgi:hypothetical protein
MDTAEQVEQRREALLRQMGAIRSMQRGTINEQYLRVPRKGRVEAGRCGPYYVLSRSEGGKTVSRRLTTPQQVAQARADVAAHQRFAELCREYERLTERLGQLERAGADSGPGKKRPRLS